MTFIADTFCQLIQPVGHVVQIGQDEPTKLILQDRGVSIETLYGEWGAHCPKCGKESEQCAMHMWPDTVTGEWFLTSNVFHKLSPKRLDFAFKKIVEHIRFGGLLDVPTTAERTQQWWVERAMGVFRYTRELSPTTDRSLIFMRRDREVL